MNIFGRNRKTGEPRLGQKAREFIEYRMNIPLSKFLDNSSYIEAGTGKVWATFRALHLIASTTLSTDFKLMIGGDRSDDPYDQWFLRNPNPKDSWVDLIYLWVHHMGLTGTAYWLKDFGANGKIVALWPLLPQHVKIVVGRTDGITRFQYQVNGKRVDYGPEEIIYFRRPHPNDLLGGIGDIEPAEQLYNNFINRGTYEEKFFENGAILSGILMHKGEPINDEVEWARVKDWWKQEHVGKKNSGKTALLNREWAYQSLGLTQQEMQSIEQAKLTINHIFLNHGVPLSIAGVEGAAAYATAKQDEINFKRFTIVPLLDQLVGKLNATSGLIPDLFGDDAELAYELSGLIDIEQTTKDYLPLIENGAMTPNELREACGLDRVDDPALDQFFVGQNRMPLDMAGLGMTNGNSDLSHGTQKPPA